MAISSKKVEKLLYDADVAIENALKYEEVKERIVEYGYDETRLQAAKDLRERTSAKYQEQQRKRGEQIAAGNSVEAKLYEERERYMDFRKLAKKLFVGEENDGIRKTLGLDGNARDTFSGVLKEARQLYEGALEDQAVLEQLATFAITAEKLQEGLAGLKELQRLDEDQEGKKGAAQLATKERDDLYKELKTWMGRFVQACRIAFKKDDQQLEKLGIPALSEDYKRRKRKKKGEGEEEQEETEETGKNESGEPS